MEAKPPRQALSAIVSRLEGVRQEKQQILDGLAQQHRRLRAQATVAQLAVSHAEALLALSTAVGGNADMGGVEDHLRKLTRSRWEIPTGSLASSCESASMRPPPSSSSSGSGGEEAEQVDSSGMNDPILHMELPLPDLGWSPASAVARAAAGDAHDEMAAGMHLHSAAFVRRAAPLIGRVRNCAPDAAEARLRLDALRSTLLEACAVTGLASRSPHLEDMWAPASPPDGGPADGDVLDAQTRMHEEQWAWAVGQLGLDPEQEDLLDAMLCSWRARKDRLLRRLTVLLRRFLEDAQRDDPEAQEHSYQEIQRAHCGLWVHHFLYTLVCYGSILRSEQLAALHLSSLPHIPSVAVINAVRQGKEATERLFAASRS